MSASQESLGGVELHSATNPMNQSRSTATRRGTIVVNTDSGTSYASRADASFAKIPLIGSFFKMLRPQSTRKVGEEKFVTLKSGMFSWQVIYELFSLKFMQYKTLYGEEGEDLRDSFNNQQTSVGLVAALLFTVFVSFVQNEAGENFNHTIFQTFEIACWGIASICSLASTCLSVLLIIALSETNGPADSNHFIRLFAEFTFGIGPISPVFFLLVAVFFAVIGLIPYALINFGLTCTLTVFILATGLMALFGLFVVQTVATLKVAKETDALILASYRVVDLSVAHIRTAFKRFLALKTEAPFAEHLSLSMLPVDCGEDSFIEFLQCNTHAALFGSTASTGTSQQQQTASAANGGNNPATDTKDASTQNLSKLTLVSDHGARVFPAPVQNLMKLSLVSERRARVFFTAFLEANLFEKVAIDAFTPAHQRA